jgi:hypothetical protein
LVIFWGNKDYHDILGYIIMKCPACGAIGGFTVEQVKQKLTLYFIPTFSYLQKQYLVCGACRSACEVPEEGKQEIARRLMSHKEMSVWLRVLNRRMGKTSRVIITDMPSAESSTANALPLPAQKMHCPFCSHEIDEGFTYCPGCGGNLKQSDLP